MGGVDELPGNDLHQAAPVLTLMAREGGIADGVREYQFLKTQVVEGAVGDADDGLGSCISGHRMAIRARNPGVPGGRCETAR